MPVPATPVLTPAQVLADTFADERLLEPPVKVEDLVKEFAEVRDLSFGIGLGLDAVLQGLNGLNGGQTKPVLLLNNDFAATRRRFTLAHELGHLLMAWHSGTMECHLDDQPLDDAATAPAGIRGAGAGAWQLERDANQFASRILIPRRFVDALDHDDPESMLEAMAAAEVSAEAAVIGLASQLSPGHVFALYDAFGGVARVAYSPGTFNLGVYKSARPFDKGVLARSLSKSGETSLQGALVYWGVVRDTLELTVADDNWEDRLVDLIGRHFPGQGRGGPVWNSACAVASAAHGEFTHDHVPRLAVRIKQRFLKRSEDFLALVDDPEFDDFASARAIAFATRPPRRKTKKAT